jgi:hypothetical protein
VDLLAWPRCMTMRSDAQLAPLSSPLDPNALLRDSFPPSWLQLEEAKRKKALEERRATRERRIEESLHQWQREVVPNWQVVHRSPALRKLWWAGIPTSLRASMWESAVGNPLALNRGPPFHFLLLHILKETCFRQFPELSRQSQACFICENVPGCDYARDRGRHSSHFALVAHLPSRNGAVI